MHSGVIFVIMIFLLFQLRDNWRWHIISQVETALICISSGAIDSSAATRESSRHRWRRRCRWACRSIRDYQWVNTLGRRTWRRGFSGEHIKLKFKKIATKKLCQFNFLCQDICLDEWADYIEECITSCNKVENCLASEYDHEAMMMERRARRWSAAKQQHHQQIQGGPLPATTGRLTLPGIGTVLEVPLLVAKRLHPALGLRSHQYHLAHQQLPREAEYCENGCGGARNDAGGGATTQTRVYQHPGKSRAGNLPHSQFPAIDEDSVWSEVGQKNIKYGLSKKNKNL